MLKITNNPKQFGPVPKPEAEIFLFGRGVISFAWNFKRKDPFWFLYCNSGPGAYLKFEDRILRPAGREIILIPPNTPFQSSCESPFEHLYIHFHVGRPYSLVNPGVMVFDRSICGVTERLFNTGKSSNAAVYALLYAALAAIPEERFSTEEQTFDDRLERAVILLAQNVSNDEICHAIGMSCSNFQRLFKEKMGISPHAYAMKMRLEKACYQLVSGVSDINYIAAECGFSDRYAFSKAFKKYIGVPPAHYRSTTSDCGGRNIVCPSPENGQPD